MYIAANYKVDVVKLNPHMILIQMIKSLIEILQNDEEDIKILLDEDLDEEVIKKAVESLPNLILNLVEKSNDVFIRLIKIKMYIQDRGMINKVPFAWLELLLDEYTNQHQSP